MVQAFVECFEIANASNAGASRHTNMDEGPTCTGLV